MLRETLVDILPQLDDESIVKIITNISSLELRLVVQFIMFGRIPPGREEDSYIPTKGTLYKKLTNINDIRYTCFYDFYNLLNAIILS